jgi:peroxiredoxin
MWIDFPIARCSRYNRFAPHRLWNPRNPSMTNQVYKLLLVFSVSFLLGAPALRGQATEASVNKELQALRVSSTPMPGVPPDPHAPKAMADTERPAAILQAAKDVRSLAAGASKVKLADSLIHIAFQGEVGKDALQASADALAQALSETPQPAGKDGTPVPGYIDLARLGTIAGITTSLKDPQLDKANEIVAENEADAAKADFTLKDLNGKKYTLSALKGKIVLINFWSTQCPTCLKEMQDLDLIFTHFESQGLVILSITGDNPFATNKYMAGKNYHPTILFDDNNKAGKQFHVDDLRPEGLPRSFVFDRDGKLVARSLDTCTQRQFFSMLAKAGLHP